MITVIHGPTSDFLLRQLQLEIASQLHKDPTLVVKVFDCEECDRELLIQATKLGSLFAQHELIVIKRPLTIVADELQILVDAVLSSKKDFVVWSDEKIPSNTRVYKKLNISAKIKTFDIISKRNLPSVLKEYMKNLGMECEIEVINKLIDSQSANPDLLFGELDKLATLGVQQLTEETVEKYTCSSEKAEIWDLVDAMSKSRKDDAIKHLLKLYNSQIDPWYIFSMIVRQFRLMYLIGTLSASGVSSSDIVRKLKLHPFVVSKALSTHFDLSKISKIYDNFVKIDFQVKTSQIELLLALAMLVKLV